MAGQVSQPFADTAANRNLQRLRQGAGEPGPRPLRAWLAVRLRGHRASLVERKQPSLEDHIRSGVVLMSPLGFAVNSSRSLF